MRPMNIETIVDRLTQAVLDYGKKCIEASRIGEECPVFTASICGFLGQLKKRILNSGTMELDSSYHALVDEISLFGRNCYYYGNRMLFRDPDEGLRNLLGETEYYDLTGYISCKLLQLSHQRPYEILYPFDNDEERLESEQEYIVFISNRIMRTGVLHC